MKLRYDIAVDRRVRSVYHIYSTTMLSVNTSVLFHNHRLVATREASYMGKKQGVKIQSDCNPEGRLRSLKLPHSDAVRYAKSQGEWRIPEQLYLRRELDEGILVGLPDDAGSYYVGLPHGMDGNLIVVGGNGSGKSSGVAMPTLETWRGPVCATDIKGELSERYSELYRCGRVARPYLIVNPMDPAGPSYDPFWLLLEDGAENLYANAFQLASFLFPEPQNGSDKFWCESERAVFAAAVIHSIKGGLGFSEMAAYVLSQSLSALCRELGGSADYHVRAALGKMYEMKEETLSSIERGIRNKLMMSTSDIRISHFLRGRSETSNWFSWNDLDKYNIFLCIPPDKLESWSWVVNLMYAQLIRHLERRPEKHSPQGKMIAQTLVLMDEFPRFGRLEPIANALATLRSKSVNFCLMVQSVAQLDLIYGQHTREIIFDNCSYKAILQAGDAETQQYLSRLIGSGIQLNNSLTLHMDHTGKRTERISTGMTETRDFRIQPHTLATLHDIVFLSPLGVCRVEKWPPGQTVRRCSLAANKHSGSGKFDHEEPWVMNYGMVDMEQRVDNAKNKLAASQRRQCQEQRAAATKQKKDDTLRKLAIGAIVLDYFPALSSIAPGRTMQETQENFRILRIFLDNLFKPDHARLLRQLQEEANQIYNTTASEARGVSGQEEEMVLEEGEINCQIII